MSSDRLLKQGEMGRHREAPHTMCWQRIISGSIKAGTVAALAMISFGLAFRFAGLRVGHYGPKFAQLFVADSGIRFRFAQRIVIGWISALPLVAWLYLCPRIWLSPVSVGALDGAGYYVFVDSLLLPISFGDPPPGMLGLGTIVPSLLIALVFGAVVGFMCRRAGCAKRAGACAVARVAVPEPLAKAIAKAIGDPPPSAQGQAATPATARGG